MPANGPMPQGQNGRAHAGQVREKSYFDPFQTAILSPGRAFAPFIAFDCKFAAETRRRREDQSQRQSIPVFLRVSASPRWNFAFAPRPTARKARRGGCADSTAPILSLSDPAIAMSKTLWRAISLPETLTYGCKPPVASSVTFSITLCVSRSSALITKSAAS